MIFIIKSKNLLFKFLRDRICELKLHAVTCYYTINAHQFDFCIAIQHGKNCLRLPFNNEVFTNRLDKAGSQRTQESVDATRSGLWQHTY